MIKNSTVKKMKILLINPPRSPYNAIYSYAATEIKHLIHQKLVGPPLGLLTIAAAVKEHDVSLLDLKGEDDLQKEKIDYLEVVTQWLERECPDVVGVTFIASDFPQGLEILAHVKKHSKSIITVAGGLHVTLCPHDFDSPFVDIVCKGQAACTFRMVIQAIADNRSFDNIPGVLYKKDNRFIKSTAEAVPCNAALDDFVMPDRKLLRPWLETYTVGRNDSGPSTYLFTSLGCPYKCTFCSIWPQFDGMYYQRDIESVIDELKTLDEYPIVRFADANTVVNVSFVEKLFDRIREEGINKKFVMDIRADTAAKYPELIKKCAMGGLKVVICGFESFRDDELSKYNKSSEALCIEDAVRIFDDNGIMVRGNYVIPPDYVEKDFDALKEFAEKSNVAYAGYTILTPMPGTQYFLEQKDNIIDHNLAKYNFFNCVLKTKLPLEKFYSQVSDLWRVRKGTDRI